MTTDLRPGVLLIALVGWERWSREDRCTEAQGREDRVGISPRDVIMSSFFEYLWKYWWAHLHAYIIFHIPKSHKIM